MTKEYRKIFNKLKIEYEQYNFSRSKSAIVNDIYKLKVELEEIYDNEAKIVLVGIYELLKYHVDAYNLFIEITPKELLNNPNLHKKLEKMKELANNEGNEFAIAYTSGPGFKMVTKGELPKFKYHPRPTHTGAFKLVNSPVVCECCEKETNVIYDSYFFSAYKVQNICPECISTGKAAEKFDGCFTDRYIGTIKDDEKRDELMKRTPSYRGWQPGPWRTHCDDFCEFVDNVGTRELKKLGIMDEILSDPIWSEQDKTFIKVLEKTYSPQGYLFKCQHCGKHLLWYDFD